MKNSLKLSVSTLALALATSVVATGCASGANDEGDKPASGVDAIKSGSSDKPVQGESEIKLQTAPRACPSSEWANAEAHDWTNHYIWSPGGGYSPEVVSCSVSGNVITYGYVY